MDQQAIDAFRASVRRLAEIKVAPFAAAVDAEQRLPVEGFAAGLELGLQGLPFPASIGGQEADMLAQVVAVEELARVCAATSLTVTSGWLMMAVVKYGTEAQQREMLPGIVAGKTRAAWGLTEPAGGSDLMGITSNAKRTADGWVLNGTKRFITNGGSADWYLIFARTGEKSFGIFLAHKDDAGISFGRPERKMGMRGSPTSDVILDGCVLPESRLLADPARGAEYIAEALLASRMQIAAHALGIAQGALDQAVNYTAERKQFGQAIAGYQMVRGMIADMAMRVEAGRSVLYRAVACYSAGDPKVKTLASMAKVLCSDAAMSVTTDAVQLHGGYGYLQDYPVERMMRDAKVTQIWEGTNQIQRLMIAKDIYARA